MQYLTSLVARWAVLMAAILPIAAQGASFSPILPPSYPLAVRNPYLSIWLPGNRAENLPSSSPQFWFGNDLSWSVIARVDGEAFNLFGVSDLKDSKAATATDASFTSTHSTFTLTAGSRTFTLDFFSPVSPKNLLRQSLPFSYLTVSVSGGSGNVQIYSDIDSSFTGEPKNAEWGYSKNGSTAAFHVKPRDIKTFAQNEQNQALWGETIYASRPSSQGKLSVASGPSSDVRSSFISNGTLSNEQAEWTADGVVALAHDLGHTDKASVTFAIGHVREEVINYVSGVQTGYYRAVYPDTMSALSHFLDDYSAAVSESRKFDDLVQSTGESSYGTNYSDILALSVRQIYGGIELTVPADTRDQNDPSAFIKEISSNGNINTVDVMYASFPVWYILSPEYIQLLLKPVFKYMTSPAYPKDYAVHEIGFHYPNATGHPFGQEASEEMPIEESGNVLIMTYAYQLATGKSTISDTWGSLLAQYAHYLLQDGKYPSKQLSLNDALGAMANQTNLAMKAASGLACYGALTSQKNYTEAGKSIAHALYSERLGTDPAGTYFTQQYGQKTWFLAYNHYADVLFDLSLFPDEAYNMTTAFYPTVRKPAGVALNGELSWGQTNWQGFVAATVSGDTRKMFVDDMHAYVANGKNDAPFSDRYWCGDSSEGRAGEYYAFRARPALGSHFALAALKGGNTWGGS